MQPSPKLIADPLNNRVLMDENFNDHTKFSNEDELAQLKDVIADPAYIIEVANQELFYFKPIDWDMNFLIEVEARDGIFVARRFIENPSVEYIVQLLKKGNLFRFHY